MPLGVSSVYYGELGNSFSFFLSRAVVLDPYKVGSASVSFPPVVKSPSWYVAPNFRQYVLVFLMQGILVQLF